MMVPDLPAYKSDKGQDKLQLTVLETRICFSGVKYESQK